ncbi:MAG: glycosyltransferase family 2 protein [Sphingomicrobium sp.]
MIDCRRGDSGLEETLASLANAGGELDPVLIGGATRPGTIRVDHPQELEPFIRDERTWLCPSSPGDRFAPGAIRNYATAASQAGGTRIIYADDDLMRPDGTRCAPHFKPSWNPDLFENHDFVTGAAIVRASSDGLMKLPDADWAAALVDHGIKAGDPPKHVSLVLHHRCNRPAPRVPAKPQMVLPDRPPSVTTIIPTRNEVGLLRNCLAGLTRTAYPRVDCIVIDNDSDDPEALAYLEKLESAGILVMRLPGPFNFSALNNAAVGHARGEYLCFLNNDVEMLDADWLSLLVRQAVRMDVGAVGARLLYPDGSIQHAGVVTGIGGGAGHAHRLQREDDEGYFHRARLPQQVSAVTAACLVVAKEKFLAVEGFDEEKFTVAFNDVDLCLKLNAKGWQSFYEPRATLIHHESKSRGHDRQGAKLVRFAGELAALKRKWRTDQERDPFHHLHLSPFCEQFLIAV